MPVVSVVLPCFNAAASIRSSIQSILEQTFKDWELIVVDDASSDQSPAIVRGLQDKRIKLIQLSRNSGYPVAMNAGIAEANGKFIARMDADDISSPTRFEEQLKTMELYPEAAFCGIARYRITPGGKMYVDRKKPESYHVQETWENLMRGNRIFTDPSVMIAKDKLMAAGGYRTFQRSGMDVDLWLRVMEKFGPCITITAPLFGKGLEPASLIFDDNTRLINQIPRILARQRIETGSDDVQNGKEVDITEYKKLGLISEGISKDKSGLLLGSIVTCLWLGDLKGMSIYFKRARVATGHSLITIIYLILKKVSQRLRSNPYKRFKVS